MAKEYLAAKTPGGRRIHILDSDASFSEYCYDREEVPYEETTKLIKSEVVGTTKDGFAITRDSDGMEVIFNDETGMYETF